MYRLKRRNTSATIYENTPGKRTAENCRDGTKANGIRSGSWNFLWFTQEVRMVMGLQLWGARLMKPETLMHYFNRI